jgi:hypothetical protein
MSSFYRLSVLFTLLAVSSGCTTVYDQSSIYPNTFRTLDSDAPCGLREAAANWTFLLETPFLPVSIYADAARNPGHLCDYDHVYLNYIGFRSLPEKTYLFVLPPLVALALDTIALPVTGTIDLVHMLTEVVPNTDAPPPPVPCDDVNHWAAMRTRPDFSARIVN